MALEENPSPSESDGSSRSQEACPQAIQQKQLIQEPLVPKKAKVKISSQSHPRYGEEEVIELYVRSFLKCERN
jgi:hypothetical protein